MLTVRIAPDEAKPEVGFMDVMPGIASSYIFLAQAERRFKGDNERTAISIHPDSNAEMMWIGGGVGIASFRAQIMHTKTLKTTNRKMNYFYGARALNEVFYRRFHETREGIYNFKFHLLRSTVPDPAAAAGVKYTRVSSIGDFTTII